MDNTQNIMSSLKKLRSLLNLTQQELADQIEVSKTTLANWEAGRQVPPIDKFAQIVQLSQGDKGLQSFWGIAMGDSVVNQGNGVGIQNNLANQSAVKNDESSDDIQKLFNRIYATAQNYDQFIFLKSSLTQIEAQLLQTIQASFE